ncbi:DnaJ domain-containing protein [Oceanibacterium hippocampi]|uniref:Dna-J like membrane chaperone protein n=1 Tax=Oceanibacterium hippocampi TaxID=745714 RepID=A0A1Y5SIW1_9PROT|nr:DnaJ domain-containing protein [Oceanibacterium hippocampi]SLN41514.1 Dna-J like membrane chaperone protein [Oceanibacterium hippocampi]
MIAYFILGISLLLALLIGLKAFVEADTKKLTRIVRFGSVGVLGVLAVFLLVTGRFGLALPVIALIPVVLGKGPRIGFPGGLGRMGGFGRKPSPGQTSDVETAWLRMRLDHDTGEIGGEILQGRFAGRGLATLSEAELVALLGECRDDEQSAALVTSYLDRVHGPDWHERASAGPGAGGSGAASGSGAMTVEEAYEILDLEPGADGEAIREAHRRLMKKLHPDHGGSSYLAAKINAAKDLLLGP